MQALDPSTESRSRKSATPGEQKRWNAAGNAHAQSRRSEQFEVARIDAIHPAAPLPLHRVR